MKTIIILASLAFLSVSCTKEETAATTDTRSAATPYSIDTCLVSGEKLGTMGEPVVIVHEGREIKFCCDSCVPEFKKNPEKYLGKLPQ